MGLVGLAVPVGPVVPVGLVDQAEVLLPALEYSPAS